jgi:hypothetical protein
MWESGQGNLGAPSEFIDLILHSEPWNAYKTDPEVLLHWIAESDNPGIEQKDV